MFRLENKVALVTGGGSGIGEAIAHVFFEAGARVVVADRDSSAGEAVARKIGGEFCLLDVTNEEDCVRAAEFFGPVDVLVNNAGVGHVGTILDTTAEDLDRLFAVNLRGVFFCCKAFVPQMIECRRGSVITVASVGGVVGVRDRLAYTATKFGAVGLMKAMALDHSHSGVRFNCICPARVETPFVQGMVAQYPDPDKARREMMATQLQNRMVTPSEVGSAALYLAADESAMVTGSTFMIDGGWTAGK